MKGSRKIYFLVILGFLALEAEAGKEIGEKCKKDGDCDSNVCCAFLGIGKKCQECCRNKDCLGHQVCKNKKCVDKDGSSSSSTSSSSTAAPQLGVFGDKCRKEEDCEDGLRCCGFPFAKKCRECCMNRHCAGTQQCKDNKCVDKESGEPGPGELSEFGEKCRKQSDCEEGVCCGFPWLRKCQECCALSSLSYCYEKYGAEPGVCYQCKNNQCVKGQLVLVTEYVNGEQQPIKQECKV